MATDSEGYDWALARVTELEVDLANVMTQLERSQSEGVALRDVYTELMGAYRRMQDQNDKLRHQLRQEQDERHELQDEQQRQVGLWRMQLEAKAKDLEELQTQMSAPRELDTIRMQLAEEIEGPMRQQVTSLEAQLATEKKKASEAQRQVELARVDSTYREQETREQISEQARQHKLREQALQRQVASLEAEVRTQMDAVAAAAHVRVQLHEQETKLTGLQRALQEQEQRSDSDRKAAADELLKRSEEVNVARRRTHELQVENDQVERQCEHLSSENEALRQDKSKLAAQLAEAKSQLLTSKPAQESEQLREELAQVRSATAAEREQLNRALKASDEKLQAALSSAKRAEAKVKHLEEEHAEHEREWHSERDETHRSHQAEIAVLRSNKEAGEKESEVKRQAWREKEVNLTRKIETLTSEKEAVSDELEQHRATHQEAERSFKAKHQDLKQNHAAVVVDHEKRHAAVQLEVNKHRERAERVEGERNEHATALEAARAALRAQEHRNDVLQGDLVALSQRLDAEREQWVREADETHTAALRLEEERRTTAMHKLTEEHKRQMVKLQGSAKKALQKGTRKRQDLRQRCQELARRIVQLQQEKATAVRICEENKSAYELQLTQLGLMSRIGMGPVGLSTVGMADSVAPAQLRSDSPGSMPHRRELRAIMERLEQNAERLQSHGGALPTTAAAYAERLTQPLAAPSSEAVGSTC
mmetsp:Transcript_127800/g.238915  ORF Transcript_127800/g.238915 Transcript_127800/m.238915 type:complete len:710 (+) Transcript_127800:114-2243(+)